jgi:hypothetical protein
LINTNKPSEVFKVINQIQGLGLNEDVINFIFDSFHEEDDCTKICETKEDVEEWHDYLWEGVDKIGNSYIGYGTYLAVVFPKKLLSEKIIQHFKNSLQN